MSTPQPYAGISAQRLVALINAKNNTNYQLGVDFTLGVPYQYIDAAGRNTQVQLTPVSSTYEAEAIHYSRLPLTVLNSLPEGYVSAVPIPAVPFTLSGMLSVINTALGLNLTADEIVDTTYSTQQDSYALPINNATCLAWIDSDFTFSATFPETGGGTPSNPFIGLRPSWFTALNGSESTYYPITVGANTLSAPASEVAGALAPAANQWWNGTGNLVFGGQGAFFDIAVIDPSTGLPAATQPTFTVAANGAADSNSNIYPSGTLQSFGYASIYTDVEPTLIVQPPAASINPTVFVVTGSYTDGSTISCSLTVAPSISLGDPMNLTVVPVPAYGLVMGTTAYVNKDSKVFTLDPKQYPTLNITGPSYAYPAALVGQTVDTIFANNGMGYPFSYTKGTSAYGWFGGISGAYSTFTVPAGSYIAANDSSAMLMLEPGLGVFTLGGTPMAGNVIAGLPQSLPAGITGLHVDANNTSGSYSTAYQEGTEVWAWGNVWNGSAYGWSVETYTDSTDLVYGGLMGSGLAYLDKTGILTGPPSGYPAAAGPVAAQMVAQVRLSSVDLADGMGITADNNIYNFKTNTKVTTTGIYRWAGNGYGYSGSVGIGFVVDQYGQLNYWDSNGTMLSVMSTVKSRPGDTYAYQYKSYASGYAQYTGTVVPLKYRKILAGNCQFVTAGGYISAAALIGTPPTPMVTNVFEFHPSYGLAVLQPAGQNNGLVLNLDGSINQVEAGSAIPSANWLVNAELSYKYVQLGSTPNGQSGSFTSNTGWPGIGLQFDGTVTPIGYSANSLALASIYTAKKAQWLSMAPANPTIAANLGALLTVAGDVLWWGSTTYANQTQLSLSDSAYAATNSALVKVCMGSFYCFGLEADGTLHEFDFPWPNGQTAPPANIIASLPSGFKAYDVLQAQNLVFVLSTDKKTGYFMDVSFSTPWIPFTLTAAMVDWAYSAGTDENSWSGSYVTAAGDVRLLKTVAGSPMSLSDTLLVAGFANSSLMVS